MIRATSHRWLRHLLSAVVAAGSLVAGTAGVASASSIDEPADELIDTSGVDSAHFTDGEATLVVDQLGAVEECHVAGSVYASCPDEGVPLS